MHKNQLFDFSYVLLMNHEENNIIRRILGGHKQEYKLLVNKYQDAVYNVIYRMLQQQPEAEELAQDVFVKAYVKLGSFNYKSKFFSWIYRIAINTAISHQKKSKRFLHPEQMPEPTGANQEDEMMLNERNAILDHVIGTLNEKYKSVIVLHYFEQLSYAEMAEVLELPEKKIKSRLFDARRMLYKKLEKHAYFDH